MNLSSSICTKEAPILGSAMVVNWFHWSVSLRYSKHLSDADPEPSFPSPPQMIMRPLLLPEVIYEMRSPPLQEKFWEINFCSSRFVCRCVFTTKNGFVLLYQKNTYLLLHEQVYPYWIQCQLVLYKWWLLIWPPQTRESIQMSHLLPLGLPVESVVEYLKKNQAQLLKHITIFILYASWECWLCPLFSKPPKTKNRRKAPVICVD